MKKLNLIRLGLTFTFTIVFCVCSFAQTQTSLAFNTAIPSSAKVDDYTFESGDVIHFAVATNTGSDASYLCDGALNWCRLNYFTLDLQSTSVASFVIHGTSGATTSRTVIKLETASSLDGTYTDITSTATIVSTIAAAHCGTMTVTGLNVPKNQFLRVTFSTLEANQNVRVSTIVLTSMITSGNSLIQANKQIVSKKYYSLLGAEVNEYTQGLVIEKTIYDDGSVESRKILQAKNN